MIRSRPPRERMRRLAFWIAAAAAGVPAMLLMPIFAVVLSIAGAEPLFALAGASYPADGLSLLPGTLLVALPGAAVVANRIVPLTRPERAPARQWAAPAWPAAIRDAQ